MQVFFWRAGNQSFWRLPLTTDVFSHPKRFPPAASFAAASVPSNTATTRDAVLDESATEDAADDDASDDNPVAGGDDLFTSDGARVDSADSDNNAADEENNALATTVQPTPGAR